MIVLHVGTNNVYSSPDEISDGIIAIINALHEKIPEAHIIVWVSINFFSQEVTVVSSIF